MPLNAERRLELQQLVPDGIPTTKNWLMQKNQEFDRHAIDNLLKSNQLVALAHGVYIRPGTHPTWEGIVCMLQNILKTDLCLGGISSLELAGLQQYVPLSGMRVIHLYGRDLLPKWINHVLPKVEFVRHLALPDKELFDVGGSGLINDEYDTKTKKLINADSLAGFKDIAIDTRNTWPFTRSSPERAFLEILMDVPENMSFEHADQLMQGMTALSPRRLERILKRTHNVKVRRLFYWFAERYQYPWFKKLPPLQDIDELGLGTGKRMLVKGGKLDTKYQITVPEEMCTSPISTTAKSSY